MYPACLMYPIQSSFVTVLNATLKNCSGECVEMYALSLCRNTAFTLQALLQVALDLGCMVAGT